MTAAIYDYRAIKKARSNLIERPAKDHFAGYIESINFIAHVLTPEEIRFLYEMEKKLES